MDLLALLICGFFFGFSLAFGIGANDVANTFGTTVGSGAITVVRAFILASIFETLGAVLLGGGVASAISKGVIDVNLFATDPDLLMLGYLSALIASTLWLVGATFLKLPVSGTQSAVGAMVGMGVVVFGFDAINWSEIIKIAISWVVSPALSGLISGVIFMTLKATMFMPKSAIDQLNKAVLMLPLFYAVTLGVNTFACLFERPKFFEFENFHIPWFLPIIIAGVVGALSAIIVGFWYAPKLKQDILNENHTDFANVSQDVIEKWSANPVPSFNSTPIASKAGSVENLATKRAQQPLITRLFKATEWPGLDPLFWKLQILTSCFAALAHGGNDVANAVAPITGMYEIYKTKAIPGEESKIEIWILLIGGAGITVGLWVLGRKVVETIGKNLAEITPPKGFVIELGTSVTVLAANQLSLPISTTFCKVGSVIFVGLCNGKNEVSWKIVFQVIMAWVFTVPVCALMSAGVMAALQAIFHPEGSHLTTHL